MKRRSASIKLKKLRLAKLRSASIRSAKPSQEPAKPISASSGQRRLGRQIQGHRIVVGEPRVGDLKSTNPEIDGCEKLAEGERRPKNVSLVNE